MIYDGRVGNLLNHDSLCVITSDFSCPRPSASLYHVHLGRSTMFCGPFYHVHLEAPLQCYVDHFTMFIWTALPCSASACASHSHALACLIAIFRFRHRASPLRAQSTRDMAKSHGDARDGGAHDLEGSTQHSCDGGDTAAACGTPAGGPTTGAGGPAAEVAHGGRGGRAHARGGA
eukprot:4298278-Pleurochrysis_carterae.AAC.1